jgi:hypothetical protein
VASGETLDFSAADLERRLGLAQNSLTGLTLTAVPDSSHGILFLDGVEVAAYDDLSREEIDRLCFVPREGIRAAAISFLPQSAEAVAASLTIQVLSEQNHAPEVENVTLETLKNVAISGYIPVLDAEEDSITIRLVKSPKKGQLRLQGQSFTYEPFRNATGKDVFTVCAMDSAGNLSADAIITVGIENTRNAFIYADMAGNPSHYAAVKLKERGVLAGRQMGDAWFFDPADQMNRGDFLVLLLASIGKETEPTVNTGLPNDASLPLWLKPYVKAAMEEGIISSVQSFAYGEVPIRAEAVVMTDRAAKINDVKEYALHMGDRAAIPEWAVKSYRDLAAYKMLDLHDGNAHPQNALTNAYAADLAWQLYKHVYR